MRVTTLIVVMLTGLMVAACGSAPSSHLAATPIAPPPAPPPPVLKDPETACRADLADAHASFEPLSSYGQGQCHIGNAVKITAAPMPLNHPGILGCDTARTLTHFVENVVQPLARQYFSQDVVKIDHLGTYDCRAIRTESSSKSNGTSKAGRLSEHAQGRAIDFSAIELADGRIISVRDNWHSAGPPGTFLHHLAREACKNFNVVLTPNHDRLHWDHIHMDTGPYTLCGY